MTRQTINMLRLFSKGREFVTPLCYATFVGFMFGFMFGPSNFSPALDYARDLLAGLDPYRYPVDANYLPYPLPIVFVGMPLAWLPDRLASAIFLSISIFLLYFFIARTGQPWRLLMLLSAPFFYCLLYIQWSVLATCLYFTPALLPLLLIKPQNALPLALLNKPKPWHLAFTLFLFAISLSIYPDWPFVWLSQIGQYTGKHPPVSILPIGPLMILALLKYRQKRSWLLFLTSLMPQRMIYDQLSLLLVADSKKQLVFLVLTGWIMLAMRPYYSSFWDYPGGWEQWVIFTYYLPTLLVLFWSDLKRLFSRSGPS